MTEIINILDTFFPTDISKFILEKVDKDVHRDKLSKCLEHVKLHSLLINHNKISNMFKRWNMIHNKHIIKSYFPDVDETLRILNTCKCCERHNVNKPKSLQSHPDTFCLTRIKLLNDKKNSCECKCRRLSRLILKYVLNNDEDVIKHERYYIHSKVKSDIYNLSRLIKHIENDISGIDNTTSRFSYTYQTYIDIITSERTRIEETIYYLDMHIHEMSEVVIPEDSLLNDYIIEIDNITLLNDYMKETQNDYIDYPSRSEYSEGWSSNDEDEEMEYSEDSMS